MLSGGVDENLWQWRDASLTCVGRRAWPQGSVIPVHAGAIHDMQAAGEALGLHLYAPPVSAMRVHDVNRRETLTVADDCGAWIPANPALVLTRTAWPAA